MAFTALELLGEVGSLEAEVILLLNSEEEVGSLVSEADYGTDRGRMRGEALRSGTRTRDGIRRRARERATGASISKA